MSHIVHTAARRRSSRIRAVPGPEPLRPLPGAPAIASLLALLVPSRCAVCDDARRGHGGGGVCAACWAALPRLAAAAACPRCALPGRREPVRVLPARAAAGLPDRRVRALRGRPEDAPQGFQVPRMGSSRRALRRAARRRPRAPRTSRPAPTRSCPCRPRRAATARAATTRPPSSRKRRARRLRLPARALLTRTRDTRPQSELPAPERRANVDGAFAGAASARGRVLVLVDDVSTTGATLFSAARALALAGAAEIRGLVLARTPGAGACMTAFDHLVVATLPLVPKAIVRRVASRYVAGDTLESALETMRALAAEGAMGTMDVLGESVTHRDQTVATRDEYLPDDRRHRRLGPARERLREADGRRSRDRPRARVRELHGDLRAREGPRDVRAPRHGGQPLHRADRAPRSRAQGTLRRRRRRPAGVPQAQPLRPRAAPREAGERADLQGHLRRAPRRSPGRTGRRSSGTSPRSSTSSSPAAAYAAIATHDEACVAAARSRRSTASGSRRTGTSSRCSSAWTPSCAGASSTRATGCASTCPTARTGTPIPPAG